MSMPIVSRETPPPKCPCGEFTCRSKGRTKNGSKHYAAKCSACKREARGEPRYK